MNEHYSSPGRGPKFGKTGQAKKNIPAHSLPPLPALEELLPLRSDQTMLSSSPRVAAAELAEQQTAPQARVQARQTDAQPSVMSTILVNRATRTWRNWTTGSNEQRTRLKPLQKARRPYRKKPYIILLILILLGSLAFSGLYTLTADVLGPLAQLFHPLSGDFNGSIDGRAWNLLLLGSDNDNKFAFPSVLTQVIMVARIDPLNNSITLVSIPRDSWVTVPNQTGKHKIDQAFYLGADQHHSFDDGVRLIRSTIEQDYGIPIDRYVWIGLNGFANVINTLGGIDIDLTHPIVDNNYPDDTGKNTSNPYALKRIYLAPGPQHLNGQQALEYVRSRHADLIGDIGRTQRQQQILTALKQKLSTPNIFQHLSELVHDLSGQVYTNLSTSEMLSVANLARNLPTSAIQHLTLGPGHGKDDYGSISQNADPGPDGTQDIILPNCANIQPAINNIFGLGDTQSCQTGGP